MNWASVDFDWNQARAFLATALEGSLSAAARQLKQTQPTLSRQVAALEKQLGVTLFQRIGKQLVLTDTGKDLLAHVQVMADAASFLSLGASGRSQAISGEVRISAGEALAAYVLPAVIERIRELHPAIVVHVVASNQLSDLLRREADIAIRHVRPEQPELVAKKLRDSSANLYAAKRWIRRHGRPKTAADLAHASFVGPDDNVRFVQFLVELGLPVTLANFKWTTDSHTVGWEMVKQGLGVGVMLQEIAEVTPEVTKILPHVARSVPYWLCTHREVQTSARIRVVYDLLAAALTQGATASRTAQGTRRKVQKSGI